jgi:hypothetical protein
MFRVVVLGLVSIAATAVAPTNTTFAATASPTTTAIPCTNNKFCKKNGFSFCTDGTCVVKVCDTDQECQDYDETKPFCFLGSCENIQCTTNHDCFKHKLSVCSNNKCGGEQLVPVPSGTPTSCTTDEFAQSMVSRIALTVLVTRNLVLQMKSVKASTKRNLFVIRVSVGILNATGIPYAVIGTTCLCA